MGDVLPFPIPFDSDQGRELIVDLCRFAEDLVPEAAIRKKYRLAETAWQALGTDERCIELVELEKLRRIRDGSSKREKAQKLVVRAPDVLASVMDDPAASPRHRVDAIKVLDDFAANGPGAAVPAEARFVININMGGDIETYSKKITIDPLDEDPFNPTPPEVLAAIAAKKDQGGGNGGDYL
jgi:hypothetical protein